MRKIEQQLTDHAAAALYTRWGWRDKTFSKRDHMYLVDDTQLTYELWGHAIVEANCMSGKMTLRDCGYETSTTKSRLNAFLDHFYPGVARIYQKDWTWYIATGSNLGEYHTEPDAEWTGEFTFKVQL